MKIENAAQWNMNAKRMEMQARWGDILITIGGSEGVHHLANLYHDAGKPIVPLNFRLCPPGKARCGCSNSDSSAAKRRGCSGPTASGPARVDQSVQLRPHRHCKARRHGDRPSGVFLEGRPHSACGCSIRRTRSFCRAGILRRRGSPVVEDEFGFRLTVVDGTNPYEYNRIDQEIFERLHRSGVVIADITGERPNCFLELGYALGRSLPTLLLGKAGIEASFRSGLLRRPPLDPLRQRRRPAPRIPDPLGRRSATVRPLSAASH